jgi:hypothetical protein
MCLQGAKNPVWSSTFIGWKRYPRPNSNSQESAIHTLKYFLLYMLCRHSLHTLTFSHMYSFQCNTRHLISELNHFSNILMRRELWPWILTQMSILLIGLDLQYLERRQQDWGTTNSSHILVQWQKCLQMVWFKGYMMKLQVLDVGKELDQTVSNLTN